MSQVGETGRLLGLFSRLHENAYQVFFCSQCQQNFSIPSTGLLTVQLATSLLAIAVCLLIFWDNNLLPLWGALFQTPLVALIGIVMTLIAAVLLVGGFWNGVAFIRNLRLLKNAPKIKNTGVGFWFLRFIGSFVYSLVPWLYWFGAGFLNDTYLHIDRDWAGVLVLPGFLPFIFADRFGLSPTLIFLLSASYPTVGFIYMWFS